MRGKISLPRRALGLLVAIALVAGFMPVGPVLATGGASESGSQPRYAEAAKDNAVGVAGRLSASSAKRVAVKWTPGVQPAQIEAASGVLGFKVLRTSTRLGWTLVEPTRKGANSADLASSLRKMRLASVAEVEKGYQVADVAPDDPRYPEQWALENTGQTGGKPGADISAPEAWAAHGTGSAGVVVAVVDEGIDIEHEDLSAQIWVNTDEIPGNWRDDDKNGYVDDVNGYDFYNWDETVYDRDDGDRHGTHVAGIIGAAGDNAKGVAGVNWDVTIMPVKFLGPGGGWDFEGAEAIIYAVDNGADVINCSWGGGYSEIIDDALQYAADHGVLVCAAAGNDWSDVDQYPDYYYPASSDVTAVVTVASTDKNDELSGFSNYGATTVDLAAPGEEILSTLPYECTGVFVNAVPYKLAFLAFPAEAIEPEADRSAVITRSMTKLGAKSTSSILVVDDSMATVTGDTPGERLDVYKAALASAGYTKVTTWNTEAKGTPTASAMQGKIVVWFTGSVTSGWYSAESLDAKDRAAIASYLDSGGRLLLSSGEAANEVAWYDFDWVLNYLHVYPVDFTTWGYDLRGEPGTEFEGIGGSLAAPYQTEWEAPWPTGSDSIWPIDTYATPIFGMGGYGLLSGTSMAAPQVSGAAALLASAIPGIPAAEIKARLENTNDPVASLDGVVASGGRLNLAAAFDTYPGRPTVTDPKSGKVLRSGAEETLRWMPAPGGSIDATFEAEIGLPEVQWADGFESGSLDGYTTLTDGLEWSTTGDAYSGDYAAWSGDLDPGEYSAISRTIEVPAGGARISLWAKMTGEPYMSNAYIAVDNVELAWIESPTGWRRFEADLSAGEHDFYAGYELFPDATDSDSDALWIDDLTLTGHDYQPLGATGAGEYELEFTVPEIDTADLRFRVRANLNGSSSAWGYAKKVRVSSDSAAPGAPAGFAAVAGGDGDVALSWTDPADADFKSTRILRGDGALPVGPEDPNAVVVYEGAGDSELQDVGLAHGTTAYYGAYAVDENQNWSEGAFDSAIVSDVIAPDPVDFLEVRMVDGAVTLQWMNPAPHQFTGIKVLRRTDTTPTAFNDSAATVVYDGKAAFVTDFDVMSKKTGTRAFYAVYAYDATMNISEAAAASIVVDTQAPEGESMFDGLQYHMSMASGEMMAFTTSPNVTVRSNVTGADTMRFFCEGKWTATEAFAKTKNLTLSGLDGARPVIAEYRDAAGNLLDWYDTVYYDLVAPDAPTGLTALNWNYSVRLTWELPSDESVIGWNIHQADSASGPWEQVNEEPVDWNEYVASGLEPGQEYFFRMTAVDGVGQEGPASEVVSSVPNEGVVRRSGKNRFQTALEASKAHYDSAEAVILVTGLNYADALSAAGLAGCYDAPILLTDPLKLSSGVAAEIKRLGAGKVIIIGSEAAVSKKVADAVATEAAVTVERISGSDRYATSNAVANAVIAHEGDDFVAEAFLVNGANFPDALAAAPVAYARKMPILLVKPGSAYSSKAAVVDTTYDAAYVLGGTKSVASADADWRVDCEWERIAGENRYETAAQFAMFAADMGWARFNYVGVATGANFADALAGGPAIGHEGGVMLLTAPGWLSPATADALWMNATEVEKVDVLGGPGAVSDDVMQEIVGIFMWQ